MSKGKLLYYVLIYVRFEVAGQINALKSCRFVKFVQQLCTPGNLECNTAKEYSPNPTSIVTSRSYKSRYGSWLS
jgi:hypothetical protein